MLKYLSFILFFSFTKVLFSQDVFVDSLHTVINQSKDIEAKRDAYIELLNNHLNTSPDYPKELLEGLKKLGSNGKCTTCINVALTYAGHWYSQSGDFKNAIKLYQEAAEQAKKTQNDYGYHKAISWIASTELDQGNTEKPEALLKKLLEDDLKNNQTDYLYDTYYLLGDIYYEKGYYQTAVDHYIKSEKNLSEKAKLTEPGFKIGILYNLSRSYKKIKNFTKAEEYIDEAHKMAVKSKDDYNINIVLQSKGILEIDKKNYSKGISLLRGTYRYFEDLNYLIYKASGALYLGIGYFKSNNYGKAENYLKIAQSDFSEIEDSNNLAEAAIYLAKCNLAKNNLQLAKKEIDKADSLLDETENNDKKILLYTTKINYYQKTGNPKVALYLYKKKDSAQYKADSIAAAATLTDLDIHYQTKKKEQQITNLFSQNQLEKQKQKTQFILFSSLLALFILLGIILWFAYRNNIKTAQKLKELDELKSRFFTNISHEFRSPLTLINSSVQFLRKNNEEEKHLKTISRNSDRMLNLVNQLLELSKLESGHLKLILKKADLDAFIQSIVEPYQIQAQENNLNFSTEFNSDQNIHYFDKDVMEKIIGNLLSNAVKYTNKNELVTVKSKIKNEELFFSVSNSGVNLTPSEVKMFFDRFYQTDPQQNGSGIGLALTKELVELYKGKIKAAVNEKTLTFEVRIPLNPELLKDVSLQIETLNVEIFPFDEQIIADEELPVMLIADDNKSIRKVIKELFSKSFKITEAENGKQALELALEQVPDIIITDLMMPEMNGLEFTNAIKNNEITSFIPVILLTAKTGDKTHLQALENQADGFITKPFHHEVVKSKVKLLLENQAKLRERYSRELVLKPVDIVVTSVEEKLIRKIQETIDKHLSNPSFTVEEFAREMGMSRMQLHRKLKTLTGFSANQFIRKERLKAAKPLFEKEKNIADVAYAVGFNDADYFSKCFKEEFGLTPSQFLKKT